MRVALLGMPNTGKSTFFNRLTGSSARVGNWPGITVDLMTARVILGGDVVEVVDLPGIYSLHGFSEDEQVVRHFLESYSINLLVVVVNGVQLDRQLALVLQLKELGLPVVVLLNMEDEVRRRGIRIDRQRLERELGMAVVAISAKHGNGFAEARAAIEGSLRHAGEAGADPGAFARDDALEARLDGLVNAVYQVPVEASATLTSRLDRVLLHPWLGLPLFFLTMLAVFEGVYTLGGPLQDGVAWLLGQLRSGVVAPALAGAPATLRGFVLEGVFDGVGTVLSFLPIIILFFVFLSLVEDSGYLSRAAFLMDRFMERLGLDGRSFVMQLMGFGCNVPALMGTRVMRSRGLRLLTMLIIPFSLCSARLQVFVFITTAVFAREHAPLVLFSLYVISFAMAFLTALLFAPRLGSQEPLLLELPPYRLPTLPQVWRRSWQESAQFLRRASGFILLGVMLVWFLTRYPFGVEPAGPESLAGQAAGLLAPVFSPLGIDSLMSVTLLFGFVAKEVVIGAMAVIYGAADGALPGVVAARLDWVQAYSFMLFVLIYTPCLSTVAVIRQESRSWGFTALTVVWPLVLAWLVSFVFYQTARALTGG